MNNWNQLHMKKPNLNTSKLLLIILGVLVAIIIGFHSKAIGTENLEVKKVQQEVKSPKVLLNKLMKETSIDAIRSIRKIRTQHLK